MKLRESRTFRGVCVALALNLIVEMIHPTISLALTEGPSQPEVQSFEPIGTTQMVDLFSGDFNYNIPLFNLPGPNGGYPVNLAYHAGVTMDDEASWVGLGWNINPGALVRNMRGLPDEFKSEVDSDGNWSGGDFIETKTDMKESWTVGLNYGKKLEIFGGEPFQDGLSASLRFNNYNGLGFSVGANSFTGSKSPLSVGLSLDSDNGLGLTARTSIGRNNDDNKFDHDLSLSFGGGRLGIAYGLKPGGKDIDSKVMSMAAQSRGFGSQASFARNNFVPSIANKVNSYNLGGSLGFAGATTGLYSGNAFGVSFNIQDFDNLDKVGRKRPVVGYTENDGIQRQSYTKDFVRMKDGQITRTNPILPHTYYAYDSYMSSGQGLSGYFRGRRNDVGRVHDPLLRNNSWGVSSNFEIEQNTITQLTINIPPPTGPTTFTIPVNIPDNKVGLGLDVSFGWDHQQAWNNDNIGGQNEMELDFLNPRPNGIKENVYYQAHGEQTIVHPDALNHINGTDLALVKFSDDNDGARRKIEATNNGHIASQRVVEDKERVVRNTLVHSLKNKEVEQLGEYQIRHYNFNTSLNFTVINEDGISATAGAAATAPQQALNRGSRTVGTEYAANSIEDHEAGFKVLNEDGTYYVYGLPAYNTKEVENLFSVDTPGGNDNVDRVDVEVENGEVDYKINGSQRFINKTTKSPYAHSYMLTAVQGADYVDITNDGPTDDDLGYWVKFNYVKYGDAIKWRAPYTQANYNAGELFTTQDDKASYRYGEKELWYAGRIETKSHIAVFEMSERDDMKEAPGEYENGGMGDQSGLKIDQIKVYEKKSFNEDPVNAVPLQTIHFEYDYSLCKGALNSAAAEGGKLTLKKVWFTSLGSNRGELSPYEFDYTSVDLGSEYTQLTDENSPLNLVNPNYDQNKYDPWGCYRPYSSTYEQHSRFPYVAQHGQAWQQAWMSLYNGTNETQENKELTKVANDLLASAWSLRKITLPSGGEINIEYESDDYSHVQHKVANQMFQVVKTGDRTGLLYNELYPEGLENGMFFNEASIDDEKLRRIYFKLEEPLATGLSEADYAQQIYQDYVEPIIKDENGDRNLYFKSKMRLTEGNNSQVDDYISGYLPLERNTTKFEGGNTHYNYGVLQSDANNGASINATFNDGGTEKYRIGYVTLQPARKKKAGEYFGLYHPMALQAWTYMQTNAQRLLNPASGFDSEGSTPSTTGEVLGYFSNLLNALPATASAFGAIRPYCQAKKFAQSIDVENTGIRLASPDRLKYGGGHRVREITITDNWADDTEEESRTYGQHFDYTTDEGEGTISSGVALYEPQAGGDENALKYPIYFNAAQNLVSNNNIMAEGPINESLFPGASVGYRKVTVQSMNTNNQLKNSASGTAVGRTGGITEHEFFTGKDFPTMVEHSVLAKENDTRSTLNVPIPIPFIGSFQRNYYHGTQAFKIELNDMHGKPKSVKSFEINGYQRNNAPITEMAYEYQSKPIVYQGETVNQLDNRVSIMPNDGSHDFNDENPDPSNYRLMGVETDLFTDQRENKSFWNSVGLDFNIDNVTGIPIPSFWPSYSNHKTMFRTYVTNKVVHRSGIMKRSKSRDLQTVNETEILAYDEKAGTPLLTKVKNEFGDDFYSYNIPAYYQYDRMGHAYRNINYTFEVAVPSFTTDVTSDERGTANIKVQATDDMIENLVRGDELLVVNSPNGINDYVKGYFLGWAYNNGATLAKIQLIQSFESPIPSVHRFKVIRSGRRNHYGTMAANYLTKGELETSGSPTDVNGAQTQVIERDVLSATASLFKDDWTTTGSSDLAFNGTTDNPFLSGNSGIFRPYKSYTYVGDRTGNAGVNDNTSTNPELYNDGVMDNVPMFTWDLGTLENYVPEWEWVNEVTRFSPDAYELENVNRLGIYSSALYGYDNSLTIAVGGNASIHELGAYDFEMSEDPESTFGRLLGQTNMNFDVNHTAGNVFVTEQFNVVRATMNANNNLTVITDIPFADYDDAAYEDNLGLTLISESGLSSLPSNEGFYFNGIKNTISESINGTVQMEVKPYIENEGETDNMLPDGGVFHGKLTVLSERLYNASPNGVSISNQKAHTGERSLKIDAGAAPIFEQPQLRLIQGKQYVVSMWISKDNTRVQTYADDNPVTLTNVTVNKTTYSKVIEGWQKIDFEIEATVADAILGVQFNSDTEALYVDDIRFSPRTGGITTYVYDSFRFWLRASLNVDNYATLFFYDEEGNLTIKKQETEEGIYTITESRGHVSE